MTPTILIGSDNVMFLDFLDYLLEAEGFRTRPVGDAAEASRVAAAERPQLALLDCRHGPEFGVAFCSGLRRRRFVLVGGAANREGDCGPATPVATAIVGGMDGAGAARLYESGIDECMAGPPVPAELARWLRSHLEQPASNGAALLEYGEIELDQSACEVRRRGRPVRLGATEFRFLRQLMEQAGKVLTRGELVEKTWDNKIAPDSRAVDIHVGRLRRALSHGSESDPIRTVRSVGYALADDGDDSASR